ncbi:hypothetical protein SD3246_3182 [Salmonella enterica subsp. enterica serovar Dublin str. SD3246]|uniref:Uncharacterized protein n=1 Tax=Salmonella enterica subsp. enterica serovar Dublin str. SD3246 TaxID=909945 RepID=A0A8X6EV12_SALDU|nr:hypothetical protein SD3246_3182 [Salmonella enterica subsp. enterica serovar Dublin str. SD3246]
MSYNTLTDNTLSKFSYESAQKHFNMLFYIYLYKKTGLGIRCYPGDLLQTL